MAWSYNGSSLAPLTDYINNPMYQELIDKDYYFDSRSDERIYLDVRASLGYYTESEKLERVQVQKYYIKSRYKIIKFTHRETIN